MAHDTEPQIADRPEGQRYELTLDGRPAAHVAYRMDGAGTIDLVHTEVQPEHEGKGLASRVARFALEDARSRGLKVIPTCSYIDGWVKKHPEYAALVARR